jgi:hypothetical protein
MIKNQKVSNKPGGTSGQWQVTGVKDGFEVSDLRFVFRCSDLFRISDLPYGTPLPPYIGLKSNIQLFDSSIERAHSN